MLPWHVYTYNKDDLAGMQGKIVGGKEMPTWYWCIGVIAKKRHTQEQWDAWWPEYEVKEMRICFDDFIDDLRKYDVPTKAEAIEPLHEEDEFHTHFRVGDVSQAAYTIFLRWSMNAKDDDDLADFEFEDAMLRIEGREREEDAKHPDKDKYAGRPLPPMFGAQPRLQQGRWKYKMPDLVPYGLTPDEDTGSVPRAETMLI